MVLSVSFPEETFLSSSYRAEKQPLLWTIPLELTVKIWSMCSHHDQLRMREVCWTWNKIYEKFFYTATKVLKIKLTSRNNHYWLFGGNGHGSKMFYADLDKIKKILSRTQLITDDTQKDTGLLILENDANNEEILDTIVEQNWEIRHLELHGSTKAISNEKFLSFIKAQEERPNRCKIEVFRIQRGIINDGFINDHLLQLLEGDKLYFEVHLQASCAAYLTQTTISNACLDSIFKPNKRHLLSHPLANSITLVGIKEALQKFFATDWEAQNVVTSWICDERNQMVTKKGFYSCELEFHSNSDVNLASVASLEFEGVEKKCFWENGSRFTIDQVRLAETNRGRVYFVRRTNDRCLLVKIAVL